MLELRDITGTSTVPTTVTDLPASTAQIYMKGGKLIFAFDDAGVARYWSFDLANEGGTPLSLVYSAVEP